MSSLPQIPMLLKLWCDITERFLPPAHHTLPRGRLTCVPSSSHLLDSKSSADKQVMPHIFQASIHPPWTKQASLNYDPSKTVHEIQNTWATPSPTRSLWTEWGVEEVIRICSLCSGEKAQTQTLTQTYFWPLCSCGNALYYRQWAKMSALARFWSI